LGRVLGVVAPDANDLARQRGNQKTRRRGGHGLAGGARVRPRSARKNFEAGFGNAAREHRTATGGQAREPFDVRGERGQGGSFSVKSERGSPSFTVPESIPSPRGYGTSAW